MNNSFTNTINSCFGAQSKTRRLSLTKTFLSKEPIKLSSLLSSTTISQQCTVRKNLNPPNDSLSTPQTQYTINLNNKPLTKPTRKANFPKKIPKKRDMSSTTVNNDKSWIDTLSFNKENNAGWYRSTIFANTASESKPSMAQTMSSLIEQRLMAKPLASTACNFSSFTVNDIKRRNTCIKHKRHKSAGKALNETKHRIPSTYITSSYPLSGYVSNMSRVSLEILEEKNNASHILPPIVDKMPKEAIAGCQRIKRDVIENFQEKHKSFLKSMKILQDVTSHVDVSHDHIVNSIMKFREENREDFKSSKVEDFKSVLLLEMEKMIKKKNKGNPTRDMMTKDEFEEFGQKFSLFTKKIADEMTSQGDPDSAIMMGMLNKIVALELEDLFAGYMFNIELSRQNPEEQLTAELMKERQKNRKLETAIKLQKAGFEKEMKESDAQMEEYKMQRNEFEELFWKQELVLQSLLRKVRNGLCKPAQIEKALINPHKRKALREKINYSLNLEELFPQYKPQEDE